MPQCYFSVGNVTLEYSFLAGNLLHVCCDTAKRTSANNSLISRGKKVGETSTSMKREPDYGDV